MAEVESIAIRTVPAADSNFDEAGYLSANPDVALAARAGKLKSGRTHFEKFGRAEGRLLRFADGDIAAMRAAKMRRLAPLLRDDMQRVERDGKLDFLTRELKAQAAIADVENVSGHGYDSDVLEIIRANAGGLVLDCGAGRRDIYYSNVVNFEIVDYDTTDVLGVGETLPFKDDSFDAVISIAVLEHVRDPFQCAREISRVLKPGGELFCAMPFLQPVHGYPHHYFNATPQGLKRLFEDELDAAEPVVTAAFHPVWALSWILNSWSRGLDATTREKFESMTVAELMRDPWPHMSEAFVANLSAEAQRELACGSVLRATKPHRSALGRVRDMFGKRG